jgi:hypothetical protein
MPSLHCQRLAGHADQHDVVGDDDVVDMTGLGSLARLLALQAAREWGRLLPSGVPTVTEEPDHV